MFEWQSVREMPYRDREMYLGNSAVIGVLDKGGKWRKRDWYLKTQKKYNSDGSKSEQEELDDGPPAMVALVVWTRQGEEGCHAWRHNRTRKSSLLVLIVPW